MDFSLIKRAGLSQEEFGTMCGVSRVTVNLWVRGKMNPHRLHAADIQSVLDMLQRGIKAGLFPVAADPGPERYSAIDRAVEAAEAVSANTTL